MVENEKTLCSEVSPVLFWCCENIALLLGSLPQFAMAHMLHDAGIALQAAGFIAVALRIRDILSRPTCVALGQNQAHSRHSATLLLKLASRPLVWAPFCS